MRLPIFGGRQSRPRGRTWLRRVATLGLLTGWIGVLMLAWPLVAHGQTDALASYGATVSGWAIKPFVENDEFQNIPATDEASPFVYVEIDSNPSADAIAAVVSQSTLVNAALGTQGANASGPKEVANSAEARYPGQGTDSSQLGVFSDGKTTQAAAGVQSAQAQEGSAQAEAVIGSYQFVPPTATVPPLPSGLPTPPPLPTVTLPPLPTPPPLPGSTPTPTSGGGGGTPTPTPTSTPTPTPTPCPLPVPGGGCLAPSGHPAGAAARPLSAPVPSSAPAYKPAVHLPDLFEQKLATVLHTLELTNPQLLALSGGKLPVPNANLPLAAADGSSIATTNASDSGVTATVRTHLANVELLQGLLTFATLDSTLQAIAPANQTKGQGQITTTFTGATLAGIPITIDENGVQIACQQGSSACQRLSAQQLQSLSRQLNSALAASGISISLTKSVTLSDIGKWNGSGGGLDISGVFNPPNSPVPVPSGVPNPTNGIATTHVDFSLGKVTANLFAVPTVAVSGGGGGGFGGGSFGGGFGGGVTQIFGNPGTPGTNQHGSGVLGIGSLNPGDLLALLFIVEGFSTAAVASAASSAEESARAALPRIEEETQ